MPTFQWPFISPLLRTTYYCLQMTLNHLFIICRYHSQILGHVRIFHLKSSCRDGTIQVFKWTIPLTVTIHLLTTGFLMSSSQTGDKTISYWKRWFQFKINQSLPPGSITGNNYALVEVIIPIISRWQAVRPSAASQTFESCHSGFDANNRRKMSANVALCHWKREIGFEWDKLQVRPATWKQCHDVLKKPAASFVSHR